MFKILVSDSLSEEGLSILKSSKDFIVDVKTGLKPAELKSIIAEYDALLVRSATKVTAEIIEAGTKLKIIGRAGVGLDNVDLKAAPPEIISTTHPAHERHYSNTQPVFVVDKTEDLSGVEGFYFLVDRNPDRLSDRMFCIFI